MPKFTASFGITDAEPGEELVAVLRRADDALLLAKRQGRDRVVLHDSCGTVEDSEEERGLAPFMDGQLSPADHA